MRYDQSLLAKPVQLALARRLSAGHGGMEADFHGWGIRDCRGRRMQCRVAQTP